ncbi:MAG: hypothetical protein HC853_13260 [Anaerolineae bacterium]|nr:hypothetical protein [Anaerolineae bacterium]
MRMMDLIGTNRYGEGAALGFIIGAIILVITFIQLRLLNSWWTVEGNVQR